MSWRSPIHMPRWASRLTLELTAVRVQRLQEISEADAIAEGVLPCPDEPMYADEPHERYLPPQFRFGDLWDSINAKRAPWSSNPWVFALTFRKVEP